MLKTIITFLFLLILILAFSTCSSNDQSKNFDSWIGNYNFEEEPIKAIAGYNMAMVWVLSIKKESDTWQGVLEVNGQQTYIKLLTDISGNTNSIAITFDSLIEGSGEHLKKGDTLFTLSRKTDKLITEWSALEPRLSEKHLNQCNCFIPMNSKR